MKYPRLLPSGRKSKPIAQEEVEVILMLRKEHPVGAVSLEKILADMGWHILHNRIHKVLRDHGLAKADPKKQKRRKPWVRYERKNSNSLCHAGWFEEDGEQIVLFEMTLQGC